MPAMRVVPFAILLTLAAGAQAFFGKLDGEPAIPPAYQCELVTRYNPGTLPVMEITYRGVDCPWVRGVAVAAGAVAAVNP